jgi:hypothetical protein
MRIAAFLVFPLLSACTAARPLLVHASGVGEACNRRLNGVETTPAQLDADRLRALAKAHASRMTIEADPETPWLCVAGAIYNLQAAGFQAVSLNGAPISPE